jgi:hypothetical protein
MMSSVKADEITFLLLYRTPQCWRISFGGSDGMACGALDDTPADAPFEAAAQEFRDMLHRNFGLQPADQLEPDQARPLGRRRRAPCLSCHTHRPTNPHAVYPEVSPLNRHRSVTDQLEARQVSG